MRAIETEQPQGLDNPRPLEFVGEEYHTQAIGLTHLAAIAYLAANGRHSVKRRGLGRLEIHDGSPGPGPLGYQPQPDVVDIDDVAGEFILVLTTRDLEIADQ